MKYSGHKRRRRLTKPKTKKGTDHRSLEAVVVAKDRKSVLRYYGSGIWKGDLKAMRRSRDS